MAILRHNILNWVYTSIHEVANKSQSLLLDRRLRVCNVSTKKLQGKKVITSSPLSNNYLPPYVYRCDKLPPIRLVNADAVSSNKIPPLHLLSVRKVKFLKAHTAFTLRVDSIDLDSWTSCFTPPHCMNNDLCVVKSTTMLLIAPIAATWERDRRKICYTILSFISAELC